MSDPIMKKRKANNDPAPSRDPRIQKRQMEGKTSQELGFEQQSTTVAAKIVDLEIEPTENNQRGLQLYQEIGKKPSNTRKNTILVDCDISLGSILWRQDALERSGRYRFASIDETKFVEAFNCIENEASVIGDTEVIYALHQNSHKTLMRGIKNDDKEWPPDRMLGFRAAGVAKKISEENRFLILFTALGGRCTFPMVTCINTH